MTRSEIMARIRSSGTGPELAARSIFRLAGIRFRSQADLPGRPDFSILGTDAVLFIDGCFWHGCPRHWKAPRTRRVFWTRKIEGNRRRDARSDAALRRLGLRPVRVRECRMDRLLDFLAPSR